MTTPRLYLGGLLAVADLRERLEDLEVLLVQPGYLPDYRHGSVAEVTSWELTVDDYRRRALPSPRLVRDDAIGLIYLDAEDVDFGDLGPGERIGGAVLYRAGADDNASQLIAFYPLGRQGTTGGPVTLAWAPASEGRVLTLEDASAWLVRA